MRKQFATSIEEDIQEEFKATCKNYGMQMNVILEMFMKEFSKGGFKLKLYKDSFEIEEQ